MKLFVQARKDGYRILYPKNTPDEFFHFAQDIRPEGQEVDLLRKSIYTIAFAEGGSIFTKHVIIRDVQRQALGNVGFSLFIPNSKKLSGDNIIQLLDELLNTYCDKYCPDYYLANKQEDWTIFENIKNQYQNKLSTISLDNVDSFQRGTGEAAFLYYVDRKELCKYFDAPYQEEYTPYKQVFFIEKNLEGKAENPLIAIPHNPNANLTGKIDLENPKYKLRYNQQAKGGVKIEVKVKGNIRYDKSKIRRKDFIVISWEKPYFEKIEKRGTWEEIGSDFLIINNTEETIKVKEIELNPITKRVHFNVQNEKGLVYNYKLQISNDSKEIPVKDGDVEFIGEDIGKTWDVLVSYSNYKNTFKYCPETDENPKHVMLKERMSHNQVKTPDRTYNNLGNGEKVPEKIWSKIYKKPKIFAAGTTILILLIAIILISVFRGNGKEKNNTETNKIESYIAGNELNLDTLKEYKRKYCDSATLVQNDVKEKPLWKRMLRFGSNDDNNSNNAEVVIPDCCSKIDNAIAIRNAINFGKIDEIKTKVFSDLQQNFKNAIDSIQVQYKEQIGAILLKDTVSRMNLNQIADLILRTQADLIGKEEPEKKPQDNKESKLTNSDRGTQNSRAENSGKASSASSDNTLEVEFWNLVRSGYDKKNLYDELLKKYKNEKGEIIDYLKKICKNSESFKKFKNISEKDRIQAKKISDLKE